MNWIQAYVSAVKEHLPRGQRDDIAAELQALLEESAESETGHHPDALSREEAIAWLRTREHPSLAASRYQERRCLVAEEAFPLFKLVLRYVLIGITVLHIAVAFIAAASAGQAFSIGDLVARILHAGLIALASTTLLFHFGGHWLKAKERLANWNPAELPDPTQKWQRESLASSVAGLIFAGIFLLFLNGFLGQASAILGGVAAEATALLPWINAVLFASIGLHGIMLLKPRWTLPTLAANCLIALAAAYLCYRLLGIDPILQIEVAKELSADTLERLARWGGLQIRVILAIILATNLYEAGRDLWRMAKLAGKRAC